MSTRANVVLEGNGGNRIILYHHLDGDPACLGRDLRLLCIGGLMTDWSDSARNLIKNKCDVYVRRLTPKSMAMFSALPYSDDGFEPSFMLHDDADFEYTITYDELTYDVFLVCKKIERKSDPNAPGDWFYTSKTYTLMFDACYSGGIHVERKEELLFVSSECNIQPFTKGGAK